VRRIYAVFGQRNLPELPLLLSDGIFMDRAVSNGKIPLENQQEERMPYVNIKITREGTTPEQKAKLIEGATRLLQNVLGKNPATTVVIIDEVDTDNWGIGGETVTVLRARGPGRAKNRTDAKKY
jgi:4-oxalocrotonate tautomerase